jgi:hypothetical protein
MSGRKTSQYVLNRERQQRAAALSSLQIQQRDLTALFHSIALRRKTLEECSAASVAFGGSSISEWSKNVKSATSALWTLLSSTEQLQQGARDCQSLNQTGHQLATAIEETLQKVNNLTAAVRRQEMEVESAAHEISEWLGDEPVESLKVNIPRVREFIRKGDLAAAESTLQKINDHLATSRDAASQRQQEAIRTAKLEAARSIAASVASSCSNLTTYVKQTSHGLRDFFHADVLKFEKWQKETEEFLAQCRVGKDSDLDSIIDKLGAMRGAGEGLRRLLEENFVVKAGQIEAEYESQLSDLKSKLEASEPLLKKWLTASDFEMHSKRLQRLEESLTRDDFQTFRSDLAAADATLSGQVETASGQEQAHERRIYLVSAVVEVCEDMGFRMTEKPRLEDPSNRGSRVRVVFDTGNRGEVVFALSLDSIEVDSCISGTHCFEEFQKLSEQLREGFGVETQFRGDESFQPRKIQKGALDEPAGGQHSAGQ